MEKLSKNGIAGNKQELKKNNFFEVVYLPTYEGDVARGICLELMQLCFSDKKVAQDVVASEGFSEHVHKVFGSEEKKVIIEGKEYMRTESTIGTKAQYNNGNNRLEIRPVSGSKMLQTVIESLEGYRAYKSGDKLASATASLSRWFPPHICEYLSKASDRDLIHLKEFAEKMQARREQITRTDTKSVTK